MPKHTIINLRTLVAEKGLRDGTRYTYQDIVDDTGLGMSTVANLMNNQNQRVDLVVIDKLLDWLGGDVDWGDLMKRVESPSVEKVEEPPERKTPLLATA